MSYRPDQNSMDYLSGVEDGKEEAAAELRRLHEVNQELVNVLGEIAEWTERYTTPGHPISTVARAAIAKAKGESNE